MSESLAATLARTYADLAHLESTAESRDRVVEVTVGAYGELKSVEIHSTGQVADSAQALADEILDLADDAGASAARRAGDLVAALFPVGTNLRAADPVFDPLLVELARLADHGVRSGAEDGRPVLESGVDYAAMRRALSARRDRAATARRTGTSDDGRVTVTADFRGRLLDLEFAPTVLPLRDPTVLARSVAESVRRATAAVRAEVWR